MNTNYKKTLMTMKKKNKDVKVRKNNIYFKSVTLIILNEANMHSGKHGLKQIFVADKKRWKC